MNLFDEIMKWALISTVHDKELWWQENVQIN